MIKRSDRGNSKLFGGLLLAVPALALGNEGITERDLFADIPVVSAVSRFEQRIEQAPASVTIISSDLITRSGAQTWVDVFRLVPGFQAYHVGNNRYGISYHGIGREFPNQVEVMVDGRSVYETVFSSVNWNMLGIGLADVDHIEVVRGSNAAAQGSNAFMGSINIVTRKPVQSRGLRLETTVGDLHTRNGRLSYSDHVADLAYRVALGYENNSGFPAVPDGSVDDGHELGSGHVAATYTPTLVDTLDVSLGYTRLRMGWGDSDHPDDFSTANGYSGFQSLKWSRDGRGDNQYQLHAYHSHSKATNQAYLGPVYSFLGIDAGTAQFLTAVRPPPPHIVALFSGLSGLDHASSRTVLDELDSDIIGGFGRLESERYDLEFQHSFALGDDLRGTWGVGGRHEGLISHHPQSSDLDVDETSFRLFGHSEWRVAPGLTWNAGAMVEDSHVGVLFSPRVSANLEPRPGHSLRIAHGRGLRAPSLMEANERSIAQVGDLIYDVLRIADPQLRAERQRMTELAYMFRPHSALHLDVRLFREHISRVIDEVQEPNPPEIVVFGDRSFKHIENSGHWTFTGGEMQLHWQATPATLVRLHYANTDMDSQTLIRRLPDLLYLDKDDRMARHSGGVLISQDLTSRFSVSLMAYHQSGLRWEDGSEIDAFTRVDAQLAYRFQVGRSAASVRFIVQNLGETYSEFNANNLFETRYFLTVNLELPE
ncbi:MAG: TonB-dependent receptor [Porticoccaceae bacterium]